MHHTINTRKCGNIEQSRNFVLFPYHDNCHFYLSNGTTLDKTSRINQRWHGCKQLNVPVPPEREEQHLPPGFRRRHRLPADCCDAARRSPENVPSCWCSLWQDSPHWLRLAHSAVTKKRGITVQEVKLTDSSPNETYNSRKIEFEKRRLAETDGLN